MNPYFTIIISIFNKKNLISQGLENIFKQTFNNFEVILINDGSTDGSSYVCDEWAKKGLSRIKIIHQINKGLGASRNVGIREATGKYIGFYDLDDKVHSKWLQNIYNIIDPSEPDVLIYSYKEINLKFKSIISFKFNDYNLKTNQEIKNAYPKELSGLNFNNGFAWNKIYSRDFLIKNHIYFPNIKIQQDEIFNHEVYRCANSIITSSEVLYEYYVYERGNTRNTYIPNKIKIFEEVKFSFLKLVNYWKLENPDLEYYIHSRFVKNSLYNRNQNTIETKESYIYNLFQSESLNESATYMLKNSKQLSFIEKLFLQGIIKKSKSLFSLADIAHQYISKGKDVYRRVFK